SGIKVELNTAFAIYGTATASVSDNFDIFARVGYGTQDLKASAGGVSISDNFNSWNYGVGGQWFFGPNDGIRADYTRISFTDNDIDDDNVWTIGWVHRFK